MPGENVHYVDIETIAPLMGRDLVTKTVVVAEPPIGDEEFWMLHSYDSGLGMRMPYFFVAGFITGEETRVLYGDVRRHEELRVEGEKILRMSGYQYVYGQLFVGGEEKIDMLILVGNMDGLRYKKQVQVVRQILGGISSDCLEKSIGVNIPGWKLEYTPADKKLTRLHRSRFL